MGETTRRWAFDDGQHCRHPGYRSLDEEGEYWCLRCDGDAPVGVVSASLADHTTAANATKALAVARERLTVIRDYEPREVIYDKFAYWRMVESYRVATREALARIDEALNEVT